MGQRIRLVLDLLTANLAVGMPPLLGTGQRVNLNPLRFTSCPDACFPVCAFKEHPACFVDVFDANMLLVEQGPCRRC